MSARSAFGRPLTASASRRPGETRSPGAGEEQRPPTRQEVATVPAQEWTPTDGPTNAPNAGEEADMQELGRRVAQERGYESVLFDDPAGHA
jgi:hypothetical protein